MSETPHDPEAADAGDEALADKPPVEDMPPHEGIPADDVEPEPVPDEDFMSDAEAQDNDTIDNAEGEEQSWPAEVLPEGARAADYDDDTEEPMTEEQRQDPDDDAGEPSDAQVQKPPTTEEQRQGDPADEPVVPFQPAGEMPEESAPANPPQPPDYEVDEEGHVVVEEQQEDES